MVSRAKSRKKTAKKPRTVARAENANVENNGNGENPAVFKLEDLINMPVERTLEYVGKRAIASPDTREQIQGANLLIKLQAMKKPEEDVPIMSEFVREIVTFLDMMIYVTGLPGIELVKKMKKECRSCGRFGTNIISFSTAENEQTWTEKQKEADAKEAGSA